MAKKIIKKQKDAKPKAGKQSSEKTKVESGRINNKTSKNEKNNQKSNSFLKSFVSTVSLLIIAIALAFLISMIFSSLSDDELHEPELNGLDASQKINLPVTREYDITKVDLFSIPEWNAYQVTIKGVSLGDSIEMIEEKLGKPDNIRVHKENIETFEYTEENGVSNETALQFFVVNNQVRRMIVRDAFNDHLLGKTKIDYDLRKTYDTFGVPDQQEDVAPVRIFEYHDEGLELYIRRKNMVAFAFVIPGVNGGQDELGTTTSDSTSDSVSPQSLDIPQAPATQ